MKRCSVVHRAAVGAFLLWSTASPVAALEVCASAGKIDMRTDGRDPCENLATLAGVVSKCAAEIPEDRQLQRHAAGILQLERQTRIDESVIQSLRKMRESPSSSRELNSDLSAFDRQMSVQESLGEKNRAALAERRSTAVSAGYQQLARWGYAQAVITNAVWRYLDSLIDPQVANCRSGGDGLKSASTFAGMLATALSHGNPIETQIMRQLLGDQPEARQRRVRP